MEHQSAPCQNLIYSSRYINPEWQVLIWYMLVKLHLFSPVKDVALYFFLKTIAIEHLLQDYLKEKEI